MTAEPGSAQHPDTTELPAVTDRAERPDPPPPPGALEVEPAHDRVRDGSPGDVDARPRKNSRGRMLSRVREWSWADQAAVDRPDGPARALFAVTVAFYVVYQVITRGRMVLGGSMWAEMGTNYYAATVTDRWYEQLVATDFGYIPLPQRLFALVGSTLGVPPDAVPFVYTGGALVLSGLLLGAFCLPVFRDVVESDLLRFTVVIALMLVPDFQTRTFINFTYFAAVLVVVVSAQAIVGRDHRVPGWAWVLPVLVISKPAVLAVVPVLLVAAVLARRGRFRAVAVVTLLAAGVQVVRLVLSSLDGTSPVEPGAAGFVDKVIATVQYSAAFLGRFVAGPNTPRSATTWMVLGLVVAAGSLVLVALLRRRAGILVPIGLSMVVMTMFINCFTFSAAFTRDLALLGIPGFDRRFFIALAGSFLVVAGVIAAIVETAVDRSSRTSRSSGRAAASGLRPLSAAVAALVFVAWFGGVGWAGYAKAVNQPLGAPVGENSQWLEQSAVLASAESTVCIPLDPFGWMYGRNCSVLVDENVTPAVFGWATLDPPAIDPAADTEAADPDIEGARTGGGSVTVQTPPEVAQDAVASVMVLVRPAAGVQDVTGTATLTTGDGQMTVLHGEAQLLVSGGSVQFTASPTPLIRDVQSVTFLFDQDVTIGSYRAEDAREAVVMWMGRR